MEKSINPAIFKAYDIRGLYGKEIDKDAAYNIGRALVVYTGAKKIAVGIDMRESSPILEAALIEGITDQGASVVTLGLSSTPMVYFASWKLEVDAAVVVTASHNPAEYNGMKFCFKNAVPIGEGTGMEDVRDLAVAGDFSYDGEKGQVEQDSELKNEYLEYVASFFKKGLGRKKVVIDFANGMGIADKEVYSKLSSEIEAVYLYDNFDGNFPNHEANPLKLETLEVLQKKVVAEKADLGIAYDGDADRVGFVSEKGEIIPMDYVTAMLAKEVLKSHPGGTVLYDLRSSNAVKESIEEVGAVAHRSRVGHSLIKAQMRKENAIFAGELSGHYYWMENSNAEMATLAVLTLINLLNESGKKASELSSELKKYFQSGEINSEVADKDAVLTKLKEKYAAGELDTLDGIRIDFADWWFNVRASNTEPKLRLNLEAKTKELMEEKRDEVLGMIRG